MRVIFLADVPGSGQAGDIKEVKNGYARNFLLPKSLAVPATHDQLQRIETIRNVGEERRLKEEEDIRALTEQLASLSISLTAKMGPTGKFYGAVTSMQLAEELHRLTEREIDRRNIRLEEPIQEPGEYQVEMRLGYGVSTTLQFVVDAEGIAVEIRRIDPDAVADTAGHLGRVGKQVSVVADDQPGAVEGLGPGREEPRVAPLLQRAQVLGRAFAGCVGIELGLDVVGQRCVGIE